MDVYTVRLIILIAVYMLKAMEKISDCGSFLLGRGDVANILFDVSYRCESNAPFANRHACQVLFADHPCMQKITWPWYRPARRGRLCMLAREATLVRCANRKIEHSTFGRRCESTCLISTGKGYKSWAAYNPKVSKGDNWYFHNWMHIAFAFCS